MSYSFYNLLPKNLLILLPAPEGLHYKSAKEVVEIKSSVEILKLCLGLSHPCPQGSAWHPEIQDAPGGFGA